ncbi:MAG: DUF362 domain-containing protein [Chloroflexi bacterium]|nr:DUF362 domain-containing protein [Chloroflexota bacterium]
MDKVYVVRCPGYDQVEEKMAELLGLMDGIEQFAAPGEDIALKVNLLLAASPEQAVTTHPAVVAAVGRMTKDAGAAPIIIDSPGSGYQYQEKTLQMVYEASGMNDAAQKAGIEVNWDTTYQAVSFPDGELTKRFDVITPVAQADGVFNLCKLKTHTYMGMTAAVKNSFGVIPGLSKPGYHAKLDDPARFAGMLLDLSAYVSPRLSIVDAVVGMEGDGPNAGDPRRIGLLMAGRNPLALDVVAGEIIGLPRESNPVVMEAQRRGLYPTRLSEVDVIGADIADLRIPDYKIPTTFASGRGLANVNWWQRALIPLFRDGLNVRPQVIENKCIACGACHKACPVQVISMVNGRGPRKHARINDKECIRCYCCHEMCPEDAIELKPSLLYRVLNS